MAKRSSKSVTISSLFYGNSITIKVYDDNDAFYYGEFEYKGWRKRLEGMYDITIPKADVDKDMILGGDCHRYQPIRSKSYYTGPEEPQQAPSAQPDFGHMEKPVKVKKTREKKPKQKRTKLEVL